MVSGRVFIGSGVQLVGRGVGFRQKWGGLGGLLNGLDEVRAERYPLGNAAEFLCVVEQAQYEDVSLRLFSN